MIIIPISTDTAHRLIESSLSSHTEINHNRKSSSDQMTYTYYVLANGQIVRKDFHDPTRWVLVS